MKEAPFGPPPTIDFEIVPSSDEVEFFEKNGYLVVEQITTAAELRWLARVLTAFSVDCEREMGRRLADEDVAISQNAFPELVFPELLDTTYRRNARRYAAALLGEDETDLTCWSHIIEKPARKGAATPWHQDEAYWDPDLDYRAVAAWLPLTDVSVDAGCMQFIPGSHRDGLHLHNHRQVDPTLNLLWAEGVDHASAVACPLFAGGATFHDARTLHYTAPNVTDKSRIAYPMEFQTQPVLRSRPDDRPWSAQMKSLPDAPRKMYVADGEVVPFPSPSR